ncbi:unnamed protein product [Ilex paraguariensis]|uniref:Transmembrane protein n=1 Tax=Ilex paraguariensis TaxID=185542 RepID=A0ABC8RIG3_9AQUA
MEGKEHADDHGVDIGGGMWFFAGWVVNFRRCGDVGGGFLVVGRWIFKGVGARFSVGWVGGGFSVVMVVVFGMVEMLVLCGG